MQALNKSRAINHTKFTASSPVAQVMFWLAGKQHICAVYSPVLFLQSWLNMLMLCSLFRTQHILYKIIKSTEMALTNFQNPRFSIWSHSLWRTWLQLNTSYGPRWGPYTSVPVVWDLHLDSSPASIEQCSVWFWRHHWWSLRPMTCAPKYLLEPLGTSRWTWRSDGLVALRCVHVWPYIFCLTSSILCFSLFSQSDTKRQNEYFSTFKVVGWVIIRPLISNRIRMPSLKSSYFPQLLKEVPIILSRPF